MLRPYVMTGGGAVGLVSKVRRHAELTRGISGLRYIRESLLLMSWSLRTTYGRIIPLEAA